MAELTAEAHAASLDDYIAAGLSTARALGNRGPLRYNAQGNLHEDILERYWKQGFYVFENVINNNEINELRSDINLVISRAPESRDARVDAQGQPAYGTEFARPVYSFIRPLSDPWGGTDALNGRHPSKMREPQAAKNAPADVLYILTGMCQTMPSGLRLYGHPDLLRIAAGINGRDFAPYNDATFIKQPGLGGAVAWHQDGVTHWDSPDWDEGIHGFNFQVQLYACTPRNGLWVIPGTHKLGHIDIKQAIDANGGSELLPGAVPLTCQPGDVTVVNRQMLHCSFPNTSADLRISLTFGFHRRASVLGAKGALSQSGREVYDEQRIFERSRVIAVAIDARAQHFPDETPYRYEPFAGLEDEYRFTPDNWDRVIKDYNLQDLSI